MKRNRWLWLWLAVGFVLIILVPLAMDWLIIGNSFPSNISNSEWVGFFGGYIGSIIGAFVSLVGIIITIKHTSSENKRDRELEIRPFCLANSIPAKNLNPCFETHLMLFGYNPDETADFSANDDVVSHSEYFEIRNIGVGPAINCKITQGEYCTYLPNRKVESNLPNISSCSCIAPGESLYVHFDVWYDCCTLERISEDIPNNNEIKELFAKYYPQCNIPFSISYSDMMGTRYTQSFHVSLLFDSKFDKNVGQTLVPYCSITIHNETDKFTPEKIVSR